MNFWLAKTEPETYGWEDLSSTPEAVWDGVRNYAARNNMKAMLLGDKVFIYHSGKQPEIVGIAEVTGEHYPDPTDPSGRWVNVKLKALEKLHQPVSLTFIKSDPLFEHSSIVKNSRLSVHQLSVEEFEKIIEQSKG